MNIKNIKLSKLKKIATILGVIGAIQIATVVTKPQNIYNIAKATQPSNPSGNEDLEKYVNDFMDTVGIQDIAEFENVQNVKDKILNFYQKDLQETGKEKADAYFNEIINKILPRVSLYLKRAAGKMGQTKEALEEIRKISKNYASLRKEILQGKSSKEDSNYDLSLKTKTYFTEVEGARNEYIKAVASKDDGAIKSAAQKYLAKLFMGNLDNCDKLIEEFGDVPVVLNIHSKFHVDSPSNAGYTKEITLGQIYGLLKNDEFIKKVFSVNKSIQNKYADIESVLKGKMGVLEFTKLLLMVGLMSHFTDTVNNKPGDELVDVLGEDVALQYAIRPRTLSLDKLESKLKFFEETNPPGLETEKVVDGDDPPSMFYSTNDHNFEFKSWLTKICEALIGAGFLDSTADPAGIADRVFGIIGTLVFLSNSEDIYSGGYNMKAGADYAMGNARISKDKILEEAAVTPGRRDAFYVGYDFRTATYFSVFKALLNIFKDSDSPSLNGGKKIDRKNVLSLDGLEKQEFMIAAPNDKKENVIANITLSELEEMAKANPEGDIGPDFKVFKVANNLAQEIVEFFGNLSAFEDVDENGNPIKFINFGRAFSIRQIVKNKIGEEKANILLNRLEKLVNYIGYVKEGDKLKPYIIIMEPVYKDPDLLEVFIEDLRSVLSEISGILSSAGASEGMAQYYNGLAENVKAVNVSIPVQKNKKDLSKVEPSKAEDLIDLTGVVSYDNSLINSNNLVSGLKEIIQDINLKFLNTSSSYFGNAETIDRLKLETILGYFYNIVQVYFAGNLQIVYPTLRQEIIQQVLNDSAGKKKNITDDDVYNFLDQRLIAVLSSENSLWNINKLRVDAMNEYQNLRALLAKMFKNRGRITKEQLLSEMCALYMLDESFALKIARKESISESDLIVMAKIMSRKTQENVEEFWKDKIKKYEVYRKTSENSYYGVMLQQCSAIQTALTRKGIQLFKEYFNEKATSSVKKEMRKSLIDFSETELQQLTSLEDEIGYATKTTEKYKALKDEKPSGGYFSSSESWGGVVSESSQGVKSGLAENIASEYKQDFDIMYNVSRRLQEGLEELKKIRNESLTDFGKSKSRAYEDKMESIRKEYAEGLIKVFKNQLKRVEEEAYLYKKMIARMANSQAREKLLEGIKEYVQKNVRESSTSTIQEMLKTIFKALNRESSFLDDYDEYFRTKKDKIKFNKNDTPMRKIVKAIALEVNTEGGIKKRLLRTTVLQIIAKEMGYEFFRRNTAKEIYTIASYDFTSFKNDDKIKKLKDLVLLKQKDKTPAEQLKEILEKMISQLDSGRYYGETRLDLKIAFKSGEKVKESLESSIKKAYRKLEKALQSGEEKDQKDEEEEQKQRDEAEEAQAKKEEEEAKKAEEEEAKKAAEEAKKAKAIDVETIRTAVVDNAKQKTQDATVATLLEDSAAVSQARIVYRQEKGKKKVKIENVIKTPGTNLRIYWILDNQNPAIIDIPEGAESSETEIPFPSSTIEQAIHVYRRNQATGAEEFIGSTVINNAKDLQGTEIGAAKAVAIAGETGGNIPIEDYMEGAAFDLRDCYYVHITNSKDRQLLNYIAVALSAKDEPIKDGRLPIVKYLDGSYGITINKRILRNCGGDFTIHLYDRTMGEASAFDSQIVIKLEPDGANKNANPADAAQNAAQNAAQEAQDAAGGAETTDEDKKETVKKEENKKEELEEEDDDAAGGKKAKNKTKTNKSKKKKKADDDEDDEDEDEEKDEDDDDDDDEDYEYED